MIKIVFSIVVILFTIVGIGTILLMMGSNKNKPEWLQKLEDEEQAEYLKSKEKNKGE